MKNIYFYSTILGKVGIADNGEAITNLFFSGGKAPLSLNVRETALISCAASELKEYLAGLRKVFDIPLAIGGTTFQQAVWKALQNIPYGETRSYREIAENIGRPKAWRAVGMANNKNPVPVFVPCHRVIGSEGKLVGYAGGLDIKQQLLGIERHYFDKSIHDIRIKLHF